MNAAGLIHSEPKFKPLWLFVLAANSLLLAGSFANINSDWLQILIMQWCGLCGVFIIYRFNDLIDQSHDLRFNLQRLLNNRLHLVFLLQFLLITVPAVFIFLSWYRIMLLAAICILGILYSVSFGSKNRRIKNIFIIKNLFIGMLWGSLILVGTGEKQNSFISSLCLFTILQVTIGSIIRDIPDRERDETAQVRTFPVVMGIRNTILILFLLNFSSVAAAWFPSASREMFWLTTIIAGWRLITLICILPSGISRWWTQTFNLLTCTLILIIILLLNYHVIH